MIKRSNSTQRRLSSRSSAKIISEFSETLNKRLQKIITSPALVGMKTFDKSSVSRSDNNSVKFSKIISQIEAITERGASIFVQNDSKEGEISEYKLKKGDKLFLSIVVLGKPCPLCVRITKNSPLTIFISSKTSHPSEENYERKFTTSKFFISDSNYLFKAEKVYLGIYAFEETSFKIEFEFINKEKKEKLNSMRFTSLHAKTAQEIEKLKNNYEAKQEFCARVEAILEKRKKENLVFAKYKDFIRINMRPRSVYNDREFLKSRSQERLLRSQLVIERKETQYKEKVEKSRKIILKQEIKRQEAIQREIETKEKSFKTLLKSKWSVLVIFYKISEELMKKFTELKTQKIRSHVSAEKIQRIYRRWTTKNFDNVPKEVIHCRNILLLFRCCLRPFITSSNRKMIRFISSEILKKKPKVAFKRYLKKIIFIQRFFRETLNVKRFMVEKSIKLWKITISKIMKKIMNTNKESSRLSTLVRIKDNIRDETVKKFVQEKIAKRRITWNNYEFYLPTRRELNTLIQSVCK